jgi:hypothetical protein
VARAPTSSRLHVLNGKRNLLYGFGSFNGEMDQL